MSSSPRVIDSTTVQQLVQLLNSATINMCDATWTYRDPSLFDANISLVSLYSVPVLIFVVTPLCRPCLRTPIYFECTSCETKFHAIASK